MTHHTLRERMERQQRIRYTIETIGQIAGYTRAGSSVTLMIWLYLVGLL
jgi:50S ribosomal subunit-associated GTPase HflX